MVAVAVLMCDSSCYFPLVPSRASCRRALPGRPRQPPKRPLAIGMPDRFYGQETRLEDAPEGRNLEGVAGRGEETPNPGWHSRSPGWPGGQTVTVHEAR